MNVSNSSSLNVAGVTSGTSDSEVVVTTAAASDTAPAVPLMVREIHKNGWLKKLPPTSERRIPPFVKPPRAEKMWVVFCIHDDVEAFLELYENRRSAFSHRPLSSEPLVRCLHISPNIVFGQQQDGSTDFVFSITMEDGHAIRLAAASREQMMEWMDTLKAKLTELGVLQPRFNVYSRGPEIRPCLAPSRDPTSPLPPPPSAARRPTPPPRSAVSLQTVAAGTSEGGIRPAAATTASRPRSSLSLQLNPGTIAPGGRLSQPVTPTTPPSSAGPHSAGSVSYVRRTPSLTPPGYTRDDASPGVVSTHFPFDVGTANGDVHPVSSASTSPRTLTNPVPPVWSPVLDSVYEPIFLPGLTSADRVILGGIRNPNYYGTPRPPPPARLQLPTPHPANRPHPPEVSAIRHPVVQQTVPRGGDGNGNYEHAFLCESAAFSATTHPGQAEDHQPAPLPVEGGGGGVDENHRPITLKEKQVMHLCREMNHRAGVRLLLQRKDCVNTIALVDYLGAVWIAGWKQREHPFLYHSFHIGDRIVSIAGRAVRSQGDAHRIIKNEMLPKIEFIIARIPFGKVLAIKRDHEGQPLGLVREGNTAEIVLVEPDGLAARHGLPPHSPSCEGDGVGMCNWTLTEVNGRPLNLFFKENEIQDRLQAVGKDISILVQPSDFVKALRKQLKTMWGYKDYIVQ